MRLCFARIDHGAAFSMRISHPPKLVATFYHLKQKINFQ